MKTIVLTMAGSLTAVVSAAVAQETLTLPDRGAVTYSVPTPPEDQSVKSAGGRNLRHVAVHTGLWAAGQVFESAAAFASCGKGCDGGNAMLVLTQAGVGAGIGALVGLLSRADAGRSGATASARFPHPSARIGLVYTDLAFVTPDLDTSAAGTGLSIAVQLSPRIATHFEISPSNRAFSPAPGVVPNDVLNNVVPATSRAAGFSAGIEHRLVRFSFAQLAGVQIGVWPRLRLEALGGLAVHAIEKRDYYPAYDGGQPLPGKYYVLDFESPEGGLVGGLDAEIALWRGCALVPTLRVHGFGDPGPSLSYGVGVHWRIGR